MSARIRAAVAADLDGLLALEAHFPGDRISRSALRRLLRSASAKVWVAETGARLLGDAIVLWRQGSTVARMYSLVVAPEARGQGLGERLVAACEQTAVTQGARRLRLEVRRDNAAAQALYARRDYRLLKELADYYEDGSAGLRLEKQLA